ncbi:hypothetical protein [Leeia aquatica]|uniref:Lipoprotein n=1 Tax=Leeia aquatica TaxID=2725557 RepID=A0A847SA42_9NEIS|nr:hypothetical protein [Leeia aquatica]NLR74209.1 hypothetical protein [Leeia aquatica]
MNMLKTAAVLSSAFILAGCAMTYTAPTGTSQFASERFNATRADLMKATKRALLTDGNQLLNSDEQSGVVSTVMRNFRVRPEQADCGKTMGLDYLKDNRTTTQVAYNVLIDESGKVDVRAVVQGDYRPGDSLQNITLSCISNGVLEKQLMAKIKAELK